MEATDEEFITYTQSLCWVLALALADITGWSVIGVGMDDDTSNGSGYRDWGHLAVRTPNGLILDIAGLQDENDFYDYWNQSLKECHYDVCSKIAEDFEDCLHKLEIFDIPKNAAFRRNLLVDVEKPAGFEFVRAREVAQRLIDSM